MMIFICDSERYTQSIKDGLNLYVVSVLPSMLPFFFFSKILTELGFAVTIGKILGTPLKKFYRAPEIGGYVMIMSMLCGYPIGAKLIGECYENGLIDTNDSKKLTTFCSTTGPLFIVGTVGVGFFQNKIYGFILLISHYLGAILNGLLYRRIKIKDKNTHIQTLVSPDDVLNKSMINTFISVGIVGGYITIFNAILDLFVYSGIIPSLSRFLYRFSVPTDISMGVAGGLIEMTKGCLILSQTPFSPILILPLCQFLITFGGLSVTLQSLTFLAKTKVSPLFYLLSKFTQAVFSCGICFLLSLFIK